MQYQDLANLYESIEKTSKRLEKTYLLAEFLKKVRSDELDTVTLLLQGKVYPLWDEQKIGMAARLVIKAIAVATGATQQKVEDHWKNTGDLGLVAELLITKKTQSTLYAQDVTVKKVMDNLRRLAVLEGAGTVDQKVKLLAELLSSAKPIEAKYLVRTVLEDLRVGIASGVFRDAIVWAYLYNPAYDPQSKNISPPSREEYTKMSDLVQDAYTISNDFGLVAKAARDGVAALQTMPLLLGKPVQVMLAQKETTIKDAFARVGKPAALEFKYDGFRILIHKQGNTIILYTRRLEQVTKQFPEVVNYVREYVKAKDVILDGEAVGFDAKTHKYLPFQKISQRIRRQYDILEIASKFPVELNIFDILYLDGKNLLAHPFKERREVLEKIIMPKTKKIILAEQLITDDEARADKFFHESISKGNEGIMFKALHAPYKPGSRVGYMVKLKSAMETLDLVIVGAEWGEGKRSGWLTSFTLACRDDEGNFMEIGKVGTGIKELEEQGLSFKELTELLKPLVISEKGKEVKIKPGIILEIQFEEIQKSPSYGSGYALRFPRVIRDRTPEKNLEGVSDLTFVTSLFKQQKK